MKNRVRITVEKLAAGGEGLGHLDRMVVFVPGTCPGDEVEAEVVESKRRYARARLLRILTPAPGRVEPPCPLFFRPGKERWCGGCDWLHLSAGVQAEWKRRLVSEALEHVGGLGGVVVHPTLQMTDPWRYRNKVSLPVVRLGKRIEVGFFHPGSHVVVPMSGCPLQPAETSALALAMTKAMADLKIQPYDEATHQGEVRHVVVRRARGTQDCVVAVVTRTSRPLHGETLAHRLMKAWPGLTGLIQSVNPERTNVIWGRENRVLWGRASIHERVRGLIFRISPGSFFQVNTVQAESLIGVIERWMANPTPKPDLVDVYCGVGLFALSLAGRFRRVTGVEEQEGAVRDAGHNAKLNGIHNARFTAGDARRVLPRLLESSARRPLAAIVDPPRAGCDAGILETLSRAGADPMIYVSCNPATLARDAALLVKSGYRLAEVQPVDMFPQTSHVEAAALFLRTGAGGELKLQ